MIACCSAMLASPSDSSLLEEGAYIESTVLPDHRVAGAVDAPLAELGGGESAKARWSLAPRSGST
jgi:hypothetical protein